MEMLEKVSKIKHEALSGENYFQSLLEEAFSAQLLSMAEIEKIQLDCLALLAEKTRRFNSGDSSSIPVEKAQSLLTSIMFTMGAALKACSSPDEAVYELQSKSLEEIYAKGRKRVNRLLQQAKLCHKSLAHNLFKTENVFYSSTAVDGISGFFKLYDAEFEAQEIHITADYPVYNKAQRLLGIEFIMQYLRQLYNENMFCTYFSQEDIHYLLCGYNRQYENLLFNIYQPVLAAALGCVIAQEPVISLSITQDMQGLLQQHFAKKACNEIEIILNSAFLKLAKSLSFSDSLTAYVKQSLPQLAAEIKSAVKAESINQIFIAPAFPQSSPKLIMHYGEKMDDEEYRKILDIFMSTRLIPDKINIIKNKINAFADLEDLLLDAELNADEMLAILNSLTPAEFAAFVKKYLSCEMNSAELRDCEKTLCTALTKAVASLSLQQQKILEKAVNALELQ